MSQSENCISNQATHTESSLFFGATRLFGRTIRANLQARAEQVKRKSRSHTHTQLKLEKLHTEASTLTFLRCNRTTRCAESKCILVVVVVVFICGFTTTFARAQVGWRRLAPCLVAGGCCCAAACGRTRQKPRFFFFAGRLLSELAFATFPAKI